MIKGSKISLNEPPNYNNFIKIFDNNFSKKDKQEVLREFNDEKWGSLLNHFSKKKNVFPLMK